MTIKARLIAILVGIIALMSLAIVSGNVAGDKNVQQNVNSENRYLSYLLADEFRKSSMDLTRLCRSFVATGDQIHWDAYWDIVKWRNGELARPNHMDAALYPGVIKKQSDIMRELHFSSAEFALLDKASANSNALINTEDQAMKSIQTGKIVSGPFQALPGESVKEFALRIVFDQGYHNEVNNIMTPVNQFFNVLDQRTSQNLKKSQQAASFWLSVALISQIMVALLVALLVYFMMQSLFRPLQQAINAMLNIGEGDGDLSKRLQEQGSDEVSALGRGFNLFASHIQKVVIELRQLIDEIASSSDQLSSTANSTDKAVAEQKDGIEQLLVALEQTLPAVQEVANSAVQGVEQSQKSDQAALNGLRVVEQAIDNINLLETDIENASGVIHKLAHNADDIGSVLDVIRGIADQTNLLALNAAIEAARAGDQGRGFAVVADEVRTLALRTQDSTAEIQQVIEKLQLGAKEAVDVMSLSKDRSLACVENAQEAGESLKEISQSVNAITGINNQIATATEQQNVTLAEIRRNVDNINKHIEHTTIGSQQTATTSKHTTQLTGEIKLLVEQFKT